MRRSMPRTSLTVAMLLAVARIAGSPGTTELAAPPLAVALHHTLEVSPDWVHLLAFLPGNRLLAASWREARIWDTEAWVCIARLERDGGPGGVIGVSPDGSILLIHTSAGKVEVWDAVSLERRSTLCPLEGSHRPRTAFSPDGLLVAIKTQSHDAEIWDLASGRLVYALPGDTSSLFSLAFSPDGRLLAAGTGRIEGTANACVVRIWDVATGSLVVTVPAPAIANALDLDFAPDGSTLTASGTYGILTFSTATWAQIQDIAGHRAWSHGTAISPDGDLLASAGDEGGVRFWSPESGVLLAEFPLPDKVSAVAFSGDGTLLACAASNGSIYILGLRGR
ncbi:MAG: WD40 repeat domain-containing protein [Thermotogota bacterium]